MHGSGEPGFRLLLIPCVVVGVACGDEGGTSGVGRCEPGDPDVPLASSAPVQGSISIQDRAFFVNREGQTAREIQTSLSGGFERIVETSTPANTARRGTNCLVTNSRRLPGEVQLLDGGTVVVDTALGSENIEGDESNVYRSTIGGEWRMSGIDAVRVSGGGPSTDFPAFDMSVPAVQSLSVTAPRTDGTAVLPTSDLEFRWPAGDGDLVLVEIVPDPPPTSGGKVQCFFVDSGCGVVPASATTDLRSNNVELFRVIVARIRGDRSELDEGTTMDVDLRSEVRFEMSPGGER